MGTAARFDSGSEQRLADVESSVKVLHPDIRLEIRQAQLAAADDPVQRGLKAFEKVGAENKLNLSVEQMATLKVLETALLKGDLDTMAATIKKLNENTKAAYPLLQAFRDDLFAAGFANSVSGNYCGLQLNIFRPLSDPRSAGMDFLGSSRYEQMLSIDQNGVATVDAYRRSQEPGEKEEDDFSDQRYFDSLRDRQRLRNPHAEFKSIGQDALYYLENKRHKPHAPFGEFEA